MRNAVITICLCAGAVPAHAVQVTPPQQAHSLIVDASAALLQAQQALLVARPQLALLDQALLDARPQLALLDQALPQLALLDQALPQLALLDQALPQLALLEHALPRRESALDLPPQGWDAQDPADSVWRAARAALERGDAGGAANLYRRIRTEQAFARSTYRDEAYYWEAYARHRLGTSAQLREAERLLQELRRVYPRYEPMSEVTNLQSRIAAAQAQNGNPGAGVRVEGIASQVASQQCPDMDAQTAAIEAMIGMPAETALPILRRVMARRDACSAQLRQHALFLITRLSPAEAEPLLLEAAKSDPNPEVRQQAVFWLSRVNSERAVELIEDIVRTSTDAALLENAIHALSQQRSPRANQLLRELATRRNAPTPVRVTAIHFLGMRGDDDAAAFVRNLWPSLDTEELKEAALFALSRRRSAGSEEFLLGIINNEREPINIRTMALHWVGQQQSLSPARLGELYDRATATQMKEQILHALSRVPDNGGLDQMIRIARAERNGELKKMAIFWIGRTNDPRAARFLAEIIGG